MNRQSHENSSIITNGFLDANMIELSNHANTIVSFLDVSICDDVRLLCFMTN
jgi:hypothetical protein